MDPAMIDTGEYVYVSDVCTNTWYWGQKANRKAKQQYGKMEKVVLNCINRSFIGIQVIRKYSSWHHLSF